MTLILKRVHVGANESFVVGVLIVVFKIDFVKDFSLMNEKIDLCNFGPIFASLKGSVHHPTNPLCWTFAKSDFAPL